MKNYQTIKRPELKAGFTLIELLVVIAVIGVLAAMLLPTVGAVKATQLKKRAQTELAQVETAIERYKAAYGFYPPDSVNKEINQLYFELEGTDTNLVGGNMVYQTLDSSAQIVTGDLTAVFGSSVGGFVNCTKGGDEDSKSAKSFFPDLKPNQSQIYFTNASQTTIAKLLVCTVEGPANSTGLTGVNPWRYNSSSPTNNPGSFDLWVDILVRGKTNRVSTGVSSRKSFPDVYVHDVKI